MNNLVSKLLKEGLNELYLTQKFKTVSYPARVKDAWVNKVSPKDIPFDKVPLSIEVQKEIQNRVLTLEKIEFNIPNSGLGVLVYKSNTEVYYDDYPVKQLDRGMDLYTIIRDNEANTIYWKPSGLRPNDIQDSIKYEDLMSYMQGKNIGTKAKPITLNTILTIRNLLRTKK